MRSSSARPTRAPYSLAAIRAAQLGLKTACAESRETLGGKVYNAQVVREYLLYPQQAGKLVIEPAELTLLALRWGLIEA